MAYHTVEDGPWPVGTTVAAWLSSGLSSGMPVGAPVSSAVASANGRVEFGGLTEGEVYTAFGSSGIQEFEAINQEIRLRALEAETATLQSDELGLVYDAVDVLTRDLPRRSGTGAFMYGLGRSAEWRWAVDAPPIVTDDLSRQGFEGMLLVADDSTGGAGPERFNGAAAGQTLEVLGIVSQVEQRSGGSLVLAEVERAAEMILHYQWPDNPVYARGGGFMHATNDTGTSSFATANCGLGMLEAWRASQDPRYLESAKRAADFLMVMANPNPTYLALHGVSPINRSSAEEMTFCNTMSSADKLTITADQLNARAFELLYAMDPLFPDRGYWEVGEKAMNFMMGGGAYAYDLFEPNGNPDATWVTVGDGDAAFHTRLSGETRGTDGFEYLHAAALRCGYSPDVLYQNYSYWRDVPYYLPGDPFGAVYDGAICFTGYFKPAGAYAPFWDTQGAGTLLEFKYLLDRPAYELSLQRIIASGIRIGTILDKDYRLVASNPGFADYRYATSGVIVRAQCAGGLARVLRRRALEAV